MAIIDFSAHKARRDRANIDLHNKSVMEKAKNGNDTPVANLVLPSVTVPLTEKDIKYLMAIPVTMWQKDLEKLLVEYQKIQPGK